jgi:hypothetical protein
MSLNWSAIITLVDKNKYPGYEGIVTANYREYKDNNFEVYMLVEKNLSTAVIRKSNGNYKFWLMYNLRHNLQNQLQLISHWAVIKSLEPLRKFHRWRLLNAIRSLFLLEPVLCEDLRVKIGQIIMYQSCSEKELYSQIYKSATADGFSYR